MGRKKKKSKRKRPAMRRPLPTSAPRTETFSPLVRRWIGVGLDIILVVLCVWFLAKSARYAAHAKFLSDECLHTYIVEQIVAFGHSPVSLTALYSDMPNNTHPLFHWLGAALYVIDGRAALPYLNVILCGAMLGLLYWILRRWVNAGAARIAVSIMLLFDVVHLCTQIFYIEILAALTFMLAALALTIAVARTDWKLYFLAGIACGLALLSKQTGYALIPLIVLCGLYFLVRRRWKQVLGLGLTAATFVVALVVGMFALADEPVTRWRTLYAPIERRVVPKPLRVFQPERQTRRAVHAVSHDTQASGGGVATTDLRTEKGAKRALGRPPREILKSYARVVHPFGLVLTLLCVAHLFFSRPLGSTAPLVLGVASLLAGAMYVGTVDDRHFIVSIPLMAACSGIALADLLGRIRRYRHVATLAIAAALVVSAAVAVARVPNYRLRPEHSRWSGGFGDAPPALIEAAETIGKLDDQKQPVLSMWTSATWYYSGHPTTWGGINVPRLNSAMLDSNLLVAFEPYRPGHIDGTYVPGIRYVLIANWPAVSDDAFRLRGLGYSTTFFKNVTRMMREGVMRIIYPEGLARHQDELLRAGVFDEVLPPNAPPSRIVWGNRAVPFIVVEFDAREYRKFLWLQSPHRKPAEGPTP